MPLNVRMMKFLVLISERYQNIVGLLISGLCPSPVIRLATANLSLTRLKTHAGFFPG